MSEIEIISNQPDFKRSHKDWRKQAKKQRRKKLRQKIAQKRDEKIQNENISKLKDPKYLTWLAEQRTLELIELEQMELEKIEVDKKWREYDRKIVQRWNEQQAKNEKIEEAKREERIKIQKEFEATQKRIRELQEEKQRLADEQQRKHNLFLQQLDDYIEGCGTLPEELHLTAETNPGKPICTFFSKTSSCRFGDRCSRNHCRPSVSSIILVSNFFTHIRLDQSKSTEYGNDFLLEYDEQEVYRDYAEFFYDVISEFEKFGKIEAFCVCNNQEAHLRGNTFIEFNDQRDAIKAFRFMQGRYYAGRMLNIEFCSISAWNSAICGLSFAKRCPKGRCCNFLHIFKNPNNKYPAIFKRDLSSRGSNSGVEKSSQIDRNWDNIDKDSSSKRSNWRWSESPEKTSKQNDDKGRHLKKSFREEKLNDRENGKQNKRKRDHDRDRSTERNSTRSKNRSRSRSENRNRSQSRNKKKSKKHCKARSRSKSSESKLKRSKHRSRSRNRSKNTK